MTLTLRLEPGIERAFAETCRLRRTTKSARISGLIRGYVRTVTPAKSPFELAEEMELVGYLESARAGGRDHSAYLKGQTARQIQRAVPCQPPSLIPARWSHYLSATTLSIEG